MLYTNDEAQCAGGGITLAGEQKEEGAGPAEPARYRRSSRAWAWIFFFLILPVIFIVIWRSMGELNADVFYSLGGFVAVTGVLAFFSSRAANKSWQGTLIDKYVRQVRRRDADGRFDYREKYILIFCTDNKRRERVVMTPAGFDYFAAGDRAIKVKGLNYPEKLYRDGKRQICMACGAVYSLGAERCPRCRFHTVNIEKTALELRGSK